MARPSKLNDASKKRFIDALKIGAGMEAAANAAGVYYTTARDWMKKGESASSGMYYEFYRDVTRAIADAEMILLTRINVASKDDWRAATWILERRHPDRWANTVRIQNEANKLTDERIREVLENPRISDESKKELAIALLGSDGDS